MLDLNVNVQKLDHSIRGSHLTPPLPVFSRPVEFVGQQQTPKDSMFSCSSLHTYCVWVGTCPHTYTCSSRESPEASEQGETLILHSEEAPKVLLFFLITSRHKGNSYVGTFSTSPCLHHTYLHFAYPYQAVRNSGWGRPTDLNAEAKKMPHSGQLLCLCYRVCKTGNWRCFGRILRVMRSKFASP